MLKSDLVKPFLISSLIVLLAACSGTPNEPQPYTLAVAHINDHHSHLLPTANRSIRVGTETYKVETGGFARVAAQIDVIRTRHENMLTLHAGDAITGTLFYTLFKGEADAALMNHVCFDAMELGNHEFDNGDAGLKQFLDYLSLSECATVVLGANVKPEVGVSALTPKTRWDSFKPYAVFERGGEKVGLIGLDIAVKTKQSSQPDRTTEFADEYETALYYIRELQGLGIEKIGLLTHIQYKNDLDLAARLPAVDFIIGGDSHTLLGDYTKHGLSAVGPYPMQVMNADNQLVCIGHAWEYSQAVGEMVVEFAGDDVANCGGQAHVLVAEDAPSAIAELPQFAAIAEQAEAKKLIVSFQDQLDSLTTEVIATVEERLCLRRMGPATSDSCGIGRQSDAHRVVAEAFLASAPQADFALQNGGGVRAEIAPGDFTIADAYRLLPFANTLVEVQITGAELHTVLEQALDYALSDSGSDGAYPHGAGIRFDVDLTAEFGSRFSNIQVWQEGTWQPLDDTQTYTMITNSFLAGGSDGWRLLGELELAGKVTDTYVNYAQSFVDWIRTTKTIKRPTDHSTQRYESGS
ncbi:bifunctional metallophosphatase/5'-nucleotidase [Pseudidiomarina aestuarii]|uniref:Bifunctional metallophosphatase/5'-nucleotidase n=1 Tax=Pseudidiomarina aestuarii TaxID=624146 RepID=A0A2T4CP41_9GAMM|nr:bifunctional metallophosphatase/5'-nucleotidase [Pseudidiomarina aestuarii]PTB85425.1 bifunctional metallophosphatase/5'-nucleotidase [Pseudidiomarina aestuarii]